VGRLGRPPRPDAPAPEARFTRPGQLVAT
jgi:hypothetical protein